MTKKPDLGKAGGSSGGGAGDAALSSAADGQQHRGVDGVRLNRRFMPYPQPSALGPALLEAQMWLLGKLLAVVNTSKQLQVLEVSTAQCISQHSAAFSQQARLGWPQLEDWDTGIGLTARHC
jgi:hypothetical protein